MNTDRFRELANLIELEDRFDLGYYARSGDKEREHPARTGDLIEDCGTVGCVAGWACALAGVSHADMMESEIWADAARWLGIPVDKAHRLFYADGGCVWGELADEFGWAVTGSGDLSDWSDITAVEAAKVLRQIADGEVTL